jgi:hypothetical protein
VPKVAALYFGDKGTEKQQMDVARYGFVITSLTGSQSNRQSFINLLRSVNPSIKLAQYTNLVDVAQSASSSTDHYLASNVVKANNWWLRDANGQLTQWTTSYGTYMVNISPWTKPDPATGLRYPEWLAKHQASLLGGLSGLDYIYVDNVWYQSRIASGDWNLDGSAVSSSNSEALYGHRQGTANYWAALRARMPGKKIIGNIDNYNDLSYSQFNGQLEGAFLECMIGKSYSLEGRRGWDFMMQHYRDALARTRTPKDVVFQTCSPEGLNLAQLRYGMASALLENGWFAYTIKSGVPYRADEYQAPLGAADEAPPTAPTASGIWMRRYTNGMVLVNPTATTASVNIGPGYKRLSGTQDPVTNNGQPVSTVTLTPRDGLIVVKQ